MQYRGYDVSITRPEAIDRQWGWSVAIDGAVGARGKSLLRYSAIQNAKRAIDKLMKRDEAKASEKNPGSGNAGHAPDGTCLAMP